MRARFCTDSSVSIGTALVVNRQDVNARVQRFTRYSIAHSGSRAKRHEAATKRRDATTARPRPYPGPSPVGPCTPLLYNTSR